MANFRDEFPDYAAADMPQLPEAFADVSWHNDSCPSFVDEAAGVTLYVDYRAPEAREFPEAPRFTLHWTLEDGDALAARLKGLPAGQTWFHASEDRASVLTMHERARRVTMGCVLAEFLGDALNGNQWKACAAGKSDPCDFIDDNECTAEAYEAVYGVALTDAIEAGADEACSRANVAAVLAARIIRGETLSGADMLATVAKDFPAGLCHTITRRGAFEANLRQCLEG